LLLRNAQEVAELTARLKYLCRLIARDRQPFCPVNGILVLLPFAATESKEMADQTGLICQHDLTAARSTLQVHCPLFAMVCDLELADGFREFIDRFPIEQRQRRVGQRFPLCPDLGEGESLKEYVESSVQWICSASFPSWIYKLFRVETTGRDELTTVLRGNARLYQLLCLVRDRRKRLAEVVTRMLATEQAQPWLYGGCYLAGTGRDIARDQAFVPGVFRRLTENQNFVSWTSEAIREEERCERLVAYSKVAVGLGIAAAVGLGFLLYHLGFSRR
jgi:type VI protein secretion system component VasK